MKIPCAHTISVFALAMSPVCLTGQQQTESSPRAQDQRQAEAGKAEAAKRDGDRLAKTGDLTAAVGAYDLAIRINPKLTAAYKARGMAYRRLREPARAIPDYDEAIRLDPEDAETYFDRGGAHLTLRQFDAAIQDYTAAIEKKPDYARAYAARGGAKSQAGDTAGAEEDSAKAADLGYSAPQRIRVGGNVQQAKLIRQPRPVYPKEAKKAGVSGLVRMNAIIGKDGTVINLALVSGDPLLAPAAMDAVRQWVYQPTLLEGKPVEVVTLIDVNFNLSR